MTEQAKSVKIVFLGKTGGGKTCLISRYITGSMPEDVTSTIGAAFATKDVIINDQPLELLIWDTAGQEAYRGLAPNYYRSAQLAFIVFEICSVDSFNEVTYWLNELHDNLGKSIQVTIIGNKADLEDRRTVTMEQANSLAEENGALYFETSCVSKAGIDAAFQNSLLKLVKSGVISTVDTPITPLKTDKKKCCH